MLRISEDQELLELEHLAQDLEDCLSAPRLDDIEADMGFNEAPAEPEYIKEPHPNKVF